MANVSESIISTDKSTAEESKTEARLIDGDTSVNTIVTERTEAPQENIFLTAYLQQYITLSVREEAPLGPIEPIVTACRIDNDELLIAAACDDGSVRLFMPDKGKHFGNIVFTEDPGNAVLDLKWRPTKGNDMTEHVFLASDSYGSLYHVHATAKKILHKSKEEGNQIYAIDYTPDGLKFATGGKDCHVRVYDEQKKTNVVILKPSSDIPGHANRILAMKFAPEDPNLLVTGSWDETIKIWDIRAGEVARSIYGMKVYGDNLDIHGNVILTGHNRDKKPLQLWDLGAGKLIENVAWDPQPNQGAATDHPITAAKFSKTNPNYIVAFSGISKQVRIFDRKDGNKLCYIGSTPGEVNTVDFFGSSNSFVYGGSCGALFTCKIE